MSGVAIEQLLKVFKRSKKKNNNNTSPKKCNNVREKGRKGKRL